MSLELTLPLEAFVRSISINRDAPHCLFIGAGASVSSGIPSAEHCIMEWKGRIFTSANPGLERQVGNLSLPSVRGRIQAWMNKQPGFPPAGHADEYSYYFERCYPLPEDRRAYFRDILRKVSPSYGYQLLALLAEAGVFDSVWSTNFDALTARAMSGSVVTAIEVGLDSVSRVERQSRRGDLLCVALHGDYRYDLLKNTEEELRAQDGVLRKRLVEHLRDRTLIVLGYSGRDQSVMESLLCAMRQQGASRIFWCGFQDAEPPHKVAELLCAARNAGHQAFYVSGNGFDDTLRRLALQCLDGGLATKAQHILGESEAARGENNKPFSLPPGQSTSLIKSNCFPVDCPSEIYEFDVPDLRKEGAWAALRGTLKDKNISGGLLRGKVMAIGLLDEIKSAFQGRIQGDVERSPIAEFELALPNGVITGVLRQGLVRSMAMQVGLECDGKEIIWEKTPYKHLEIYRWKCVAHKAAVVSLNRSHGRQYLVLMPTVVGRPVCGGELPAFVEKELKRKILSIQYNKEFNGELEYWREKLFSVSGGGFEYPPNTASTFKFHVRRTPAFARIDTPRPEKALKIPDKYSNLLQFTGLCLPEPAVVFASRDGSRIQKEIHPIHGLLSNRPYDYSLTTSGLAADVQLGVVCSRQEASAVDGFLAKIRQRVRANSKKGYLCDYPGFSQAFGLPFVSPQPIDRAWSMCPEPEGNNDREKALSLVKHVRACIEKIVGATSVRLVLVFIPDRWAKYADYANEEEEINLHDLTKAYCVQRGIATQVLKERTLAKKFDCEVVWWLALSLYAKSMRTPWILDGLSSTTAFVGMGFSVLKKAQAGGHVVLGCSHIYSAEGMGLNYRLSKIDNPVFVRKNPHLTEEDAYRFAEDIRQLFFESNGRLPERVVIHKRTPFLRGEREGLLRGMKDVQMVDLVEINVEATIRCTASIVTSDGFAPGGVPVDRGTAILFDRFKFLLWVNGNAHPMPEVDYYMGRFRIPAPIMVKKHWGPTNAEDLASEILALSKMNWNTFDFYTRLPATIHSSNEIARIGRLLQRFERESYDYRLFI